MLWKENDIMAKEMTIAEIKADIAKKIRRGATKTHSDGVDVIEASFDTFYSQGNPVRPRSHTLPGSQYTPPPQISEFSAHMELGYEGDQISYSDGTFSGGEVLGATMTGTYGVLGDPSYDEESFKKILDAAEKNFAKEFG